VGIHPDDGITQFGARAGIYQPEERIEKHLTCLLKGYLMLRLILASFHLIPDEPDSIQLMVFVHGANIELCIDVVNTLRKL
jgi:hypothetical protein